jgi:hypothetical protein
MRRRRTVVSALIASLLAGVVALEVSPAPLQAVNMDGEWSALGSGMPDGTVFQIVSDGAGNLYAGGTFTSASGVSGTSKIAKWDGASWTALGKGVSASTYGVFAVGVDTAANPDVVYVGGDITQVKKADNTTVAVNWTAKFDSTNDWSALATASGNGVVSTSDPDDAVEEIALSGQTAYLAGRFDGVTGDGTPQDNFAKFSGGTLSEVASSSETNYYVNGLTIDGSGNPILTGQFTGVTDAGGQETFRRVAKWDVATSRWVGFGTGPSGPFNNIAAAVAADGSDVFVGGNFTKVQNNNVDVANTNGIAMWDDSASAWVSIGSVGGTVVEELRVIDHGGTKYLYAGGVFNSIGGVSAVNIARMNLTTPGVWEPLTVGCVNGVNGAVRSIVDAGNGAVYVSGGFTDAGGVAAADRIAKFTPGAAQACGGGSVLLSSPTNFEITKVTGGPKQGGKYGQYVTLGWTNSGPLPPLFFKVTVDRVKDTVKGAGTSWSVISSHPELDCWTTQLSCTIFMPYSTWDNGFGLSESKFTLYGYSFSGAAAPLTIEPPDPDAPTIPPGAPTNVVATALNNRDVRVTWTKPADQGTYPITNYLVQATPSGRVCISRMNDPVLEACTFTKLTPGVNYTFKVQGLNGAGWGQYSSASNAASPVDLEITKSNRNKRTFLGINLGSTVTFEGTAPGTVANSTISVWVQWLDSNGRPLTNWELQPGVRTNASGKFSFKGNFPRARNGQRMNVKVQTAATCFNSVNYQPCVAQSNTVVLRSV